MSREVERLRERAIEIYFVGQVRALGGHAPKWSSPGSAGVPDRIAILPGGHTVFVELKAPGGELSPLQKQWLQKLEKLGHQVAVLWSKADVDQFISEVKRNAVHPA